MNNHPELVKIPKWTSFIRRYMLCCNHNEFYKILHESCHNFANENHTLENPPLGKLYVPYWVFKCFNNSIFTLDFWSVIASQLLQLSNFVWTENAWHFQTDKRFCHKAINLFIRHIHCRSHTEERFENISRQAVGLVLLFIIQNQCVSLRLKMCTSLMQIQPLI